MLKKIALITLFVGVTFGMAYLLYRFFFAGAPATEPEVVPPTVTPGGGLPTAGEGVPTTPGAGEPGGLPTAPTTPTGPEAPAPGQPAGGTPIGEAGTNALGAAATAGGMSYYNTTDQRFYGVNAQGEAVPLSDRRFPSVEAVTWDDDARRAIIEFPDQSKIIYDFVSESQVTIPRHWEDFDFSADGETVVGKSIGLDPANRWLISFAADGSSTRLIEPLGENADKVTVSVSPDASIVAFSDTGDPVGFDSRDLLPIGQNQENLRAMRVEGFDFIPQWSPGGSRLLYSAAAAGDDYMPALWAVRADGTSVGEGRTKLNVRTWADKCTFAGDDIVYCAEPTQLPVGAGLQRDIADGTPDRLVKIELSSGTARAITPEGFGSAVRTMTVSEDGASIFVVDLLGRVTKYPLR